MAQAERLARDESIGYPTTMLGCPPGNVQCPTGAVRPAVTGRPTIAECEAVDRPARGDFRGPGFAHHG
jgi:hypothetical protein